MSLVTVATEKTKAGDRPGNYREKGFHLVLPCLDDANRMIIIRGSPVFGGCCLI